MRMSYCLATMMFIAASPLPAQDGKAIFEGKGNCHVCHGKDGRGTMLAPNLTDSTWINVDGSLAAIRQLIVTGVDKPKQHPAPMPAMGGARLSDKELDAVAAYVLTLAGKAAGGG